MARLRKGEQERHVAVDALLLQRLAGADALPGRRYLRSSTNFSRHSLSVEEAMALSVLRVLLYRVSGKSMEEAVHHSAVHDVSYRACVKQAGCFSLRVGLCRLE